MQGQFCLPPKASEASKEDITILQLINPNFFAPNMLHCGHVPYSLNTTFLLFFAALCL